MQLKDIGCLDLGVTTDMEGEKNPTDLSSLLYGSCLIEDWGIEGEANVFDDWLRTDWLMTKFMDKEALGKEHARVMGHAFGYIHAVVRGSETNREVHKVCG